jgi:hypothetical protein
MDQRDEFSKWMDAVEEALTSEAPLAEDMPPVANQCGCGSWDCGVCFPEQGEMPGMHGALDGLGGANVAAPATCPACGGEIEQHQCGAQGMDPMAGMGAEPEPNVVFGPVEDGLEEMPLDAMGDDSAEDDIEIDDQMQAPMEEEPQTFKQMPRSSDGRGVKLGDIVQNTEYRKVGDESPLTYGEDNLDEELPPGANPDDFGKAGRYAQDSFGNLNEFGDEELNPDDPLAARDYHNELATSPGSEQDIAQMEEWVSSILHMQSQGLSKSPNVYDESDFAAMGPDQVKKVYQEVTGNMAEQGMYTMENIDNDVAAMIATLRKYDTMVAEKKNPAKDKVKEDEDSDKKNPWEKLGADKKEGGEKSSKTHKGGTVTKTDSGLSHKGTYGSGKDEVKESAPVADPEVLSWMARFAKLPR